MIQRDYIERLIQQCAEFLQRALSLRRAGQPERAIELVREARDQLAGPLRPLLERLEAGSLVQVVGPGQHEHVRAYAALLGEEGLIHGQLGDSVSAHLCCRRAVELYAALSLAGVPMRPVDLERIALLRGALEPAGGLDERYRDELDRLRGGRR
ncbi:MAG TPA: hypothetical protein VOB72_04600 [Candidatus Dormibacteraeota bacterium]|nr:hypothetical protein [Candidatus Dormibacteraeota bacterium]